jgi:hypothetical protein
MIESIHFLEELLARGTLKDLKMQKKEKEGLS